MRIRELFEVKIDPKRVFGLDILRAFAIFFVLLGHSRYLIKPYINSKVYEFFLLDGVSIFFVLSGFLIGGILIKIIDKTNFEAKDLTNFWIRRWYRTLPNYYLILIILFILTYFLKGFRPAPHFFVFLQNFYKAIPTNFFFPEAWSLSIEEWFYLIIPSILFLTLRRFKAKREVIFVLIIVVLVSVTFVRTYRAIYYNCTDIACWVNNIRQLVITRLDSMMFGFLGAYLNYYRADIWEKSKDARFFAGLVLILIPQVYDYTIGGMFFKNYLDFTLIPLGTLLLLPKLYSIKQGRGFIYKWLTIISLISYSLYLVHYSIIEDILLTIVLNKFSFFAVQNLAGSFLKYALFWILSISFSILLYKYYEIPMTNLRDRKKRYNKAG